MRKKTGRFDSQPRHEIDGVDGENHGVVEREFDFSADAKNPVAESSQSGRSTEQRLASNRSIEGVGGESDSSLIERLRRGDRSAYGDLVERYQAKLLRVLYRIVVNSHIAEDLAQETFLKAYKRLDQFDASRRFGPWLMQIAVNGAVDWIRRNRRQPKLSWSDGGERTGVEAVDPDPRPMLELQEEVRHVLDKLPIEYRVVLALRDLEGIPCSEIAAIIDRQEPTVRWRLLKARDMFKTMWRRRERRA